MRAIVSFAAAAMVTMSPLAAQGTSPVVLGPGEVLAQVAGTGQVLNRPEIARFRLIVTGRAENAAAARAACDAAVHDLLSCEKWACQMMQSLCCHLGPPRSASSAMKPIPKTTNPIQPLRRRS